MPAAVQWAAAVLPLTHTVDIVRPLLTGHAVKQFGLHLLILLGYFRVSLALAILQVRCRLLQWKKNQQKQYVSASYLPSQGS